MASVNGSQHQTTYAPSPSPPISSLLRRSSPKSTARPTLPELSPVSSYCSPSVSPTSVALPTLPTFNLRGPPLQPRPHSYPHNQDSNSYRQLSADYGLPPSAPMRMPFSMPVLHSSQNPPPPSHYRRRSAGSSGGSLESMSSVMSRITVSSAATDDDAFHLSKSKERSSQAATPSRRPYATWGASGYRYPAPAHSR